MLGSRSGLGGRLVVSRTPEECGARAAVAGAGHIAAALRGRGEARVIVATGASQFALFERLIDAADIDWSRVTAFHLDEYVGLSGDHPASFRRYLRERFVGRLPGPLAAFWELDGEARDLGAECRRVGDAVRERPIDVAFVGIGENGHLAFNDPPADFDTDEAYLVVDLDEACRRQQVGEGWFGGLDSVPRRAISMSIRQILRSRAIVCTAPDARKARAVRDAVEGPVTPDVPASALQLHDDVAMFVDPASASLLSTGSSTE